MNAGRNSCAAGDLGEDSKHAYRGYNSGPVNYKYFSFFGQMYRIDILLPVANAMHPTSLDIQRVSGRGKYSGGKSSKNYILKEFW